MIKMTPESSQEQDTTQAPKATRAEPVLVTAAEVMASSAAAPGIPRTTIATRFVRLVWAALTSLRTAFTITKADARPKGKRSYIADARISRDMDRP
jgi:hypothetical protein